jgi:hypothetical protein
MEDAYVVQIDPTLKHPEEGDPLAARFDEGEPDPRIHDSQGNPRTAGSRAEIRGPQRACREQGMDEQRVTEEMIENLTGRLEGRDAVSPVPEQEQLGIAGETRKIF